MNSSEKLPVHVFFRHGARGVSRGALDPFTDTAVAEEWHDDSLEKVTPLGLEQCKHVGKHIGQVLMQGKETPVIWHSSKVNRVVNSGRSFLQGLREVGCVNDVPDEPTLIDTSIDPDHFYRGYLHNKQYKAAADELRHGPIFQAHAKEHKKLLDRLEPSLEQLDLAKKLNVTTYFEEIFECEKFWRGPPKSKLLADMNHDIKDQISSLGRWCWDQRFFKLPESRTLGEPLIELVKKPPVVEDGTVFVHSCHDYTIMSLLSTLGQENYPDHTMGYAAYMIIENGHVTVNPIPFPDPDSFSICQKYEYTFKL